MMRGEALRLVLVWAALGALLALTVTLSFLPMGVWRLPASLAIAAAKGGLIVWFFMELRGAGGLTRIAALVSLLFLTLLIGLPGLDEAIRVR
jgi:cytochrome c oxidase subunit 4